MHISRMEDSSNELILSYTYNLQQQKHLPYTQPVSPAKAVQQQACDQAHD